MKTFFAMELGREVDEISRLQQQSSDNKIEAEEEIRNRIETLRKKIITGEDTTGDPIRDFVIVSHETISSESEQPYRQLQEKLKNREGEQVLVVNEKIESDYESGCYGSLGYTSVESTLRLGVLTSDIRFEIGDGERMDFLTLISPYSKDDLTGPRIILPTETYAEKCDVRFSPYNLLRYSLIVQPTAFITFPIAKL